MSGSNRQTNKQLKSHTTTANQTDFDSIRHALENVPEAGEGDWVSARIAHHDSIRDVVNEQLAKQVLANQASFLLGMQHVRDVSQGLTHTVAHSNDARAQLRNADSALAVSALALAKTQRRRARLAALQASLCAIQTLRATETAMTDALRDERFVDAVEAYSSLYTAFYGGNGGGGGGGDGDGGVGDCDVNVISSLSSPSSSSSSTLAARFACVRPLRCRTRSAPALILSTIVAAVSRVCLTFDATT
jgi:hypothetical protein